MSAAAEDRRNRFYNRPDEVARRERARNPPKADPVTALRAAHRDEMAELGQRQRREGLELVHQQTAKRASGMLGAGAREAPEAAHAERVERDKLAAHHAKEKRELTHKHRAALEHTAAKHGAR